MRLTGVLDSLVTDVNPERRWWTRTTALLFIVVAMPMVFLLDWRSNAAPVQHLYYLPIIVAAIWLGTGASLATALSAVVLYHLSNPVLLTWHYEETDIVQVALFIAVGLVTARLTGDARRFRVLAATDDLTGLHNLRSFESALRRLIGRAIAVQGSLALLVLDVDRLKRLNDVHGHLTGAEAVRAVGQLIAEGIPAGAVACRYGGDEFAIAVPDCGAERASELANRLRGLVAGTAPTLAGERFPAGTLSISVGIGCWWPAGGDAAPTATAAAAIGEDLFKTADRALYVAKSSGRNRVSVASPRIAVELARPTSARW